MRDDLVAWLNSTDVSVAAQAGVRTMRLAQVLAGFIGGVEAIDGDDPGAPPASTVREVGREKLDAVLEWMTAQDLDMAVLWGRFRPELHRMAATLATPDRPVHLLMGQQDPAEREAAKLAFAPGTSTHKALLVGNPQAGGAGINLAAAHVGIYVSHSFSLKDRQQSEGRLNRPGQTQPVRFVDVIAVGPDGQKTLDHAMLRALRDKQDVAEWTAQTWMEVLNAE
jgi:hypothetical protein